MRKAVLIFVCFVILICALCGCQATPDKPIIVNRSDNALENTIEDVPAPEIEVIPAEKIKETAGGMIISEHWTESFERGGIAVNVDADILMPNVSKYPVYRVEQVPMDEHFIKEMIDKFLKNGYNITNGAAFDGFGPISKEDMIGKIVHIEKRLTELKEGKCDPDEKDVPIEELIADAEYWLEYWKNAYTDPAYNSFEPLPLEYSAEEFEKEGYTSPMYVAETTDGEIYQLVIEHSNYESTPGVFSTHLGFHKDYDNYDYAGAVSTEKAIEIADAFLEKLGMAEDYVFYSEYDYEEGMAEDYNYLNYVRCYDGIPESMEFTVSGPSVISAEEDKLNRPILRENMMFNIDKNGVVGFSWSEPYVVIDTENRNVQMKTLEEVKEIFRDQIFYNTAHQGTMQIDIHTIRLGYCLTYVKDEGGFRIVPVWDFIGEDKTTDGLSVGGSFAAVNAIDGSIINRDMGY